MIPLDAYAFLSKYRDLRTIQNHVEGNDIRIVRFNVIAKEREGLRRQKGTLQSFSDFLDKLQGAQEKGNLDAIIEREFKHDIALTIADSWLQGVTTDSGGYLQGVQFALGIGWISQTDFIVLDESLGRMIDDSTHTITEKFGYRFENLSLSQKLRKLINLATDLKNAKILATEKKQLVPSEIAEQLEEQYSYVYAEAKLLLTEYVFAQVKLPNSELASFQLQQINSEVESLQIKLKRIDGYLRPIAKLLERAGFETDLNGLLVKQEN